MWTDGNGFFYVGDCREGDREATPEEVAAWEAAQVKPAILSQISTLESQTLLPRVTREFMLAAFAAQAAAAGIDPMTNFGYRKVKELDDQIAALRAQL